MTVELKQDDIGLLISVLTQDIERVGDVKEKYGFCDPSYFYRLIDIRNKLLAIPVAEEVPQVLIIRKRGSEVTPILIRKSKSLNGELVEQGGRRMILTQEVSNVQERT